MRIAEYDFYDFEPEEFMAVDITAYSNLALKEMDYFIWTMFPNDLALQEWRKKKLDPVIKVEDLVEQPEMYE